MTEESSTFSKTLLAILLINIAVMVWLALTNNTELLSYSVYLFIFLWGVHKFGCWMAKEDIRVGLSLKISKNAHPWVRAIGLLISLFLMIYGGIKLAVAIAPMLTQ